MSSPPRLGAVTALSSVYIARRNVQPPTQLILDGTTTLVVTSLGGGFGQTFRVVARILSPKGELQSIEYSIDVSPPGPATLGFYLPPGYLLGVSLSDVNAQSTLEPVWCKLSLGVGQGFVAVPLQDLVCGYVTEVSGLVWPYGTQQLPDEPPWRYRVIALDNSGVPGSVIGHDVDYPRCLEVYAITFRLDTSAVAAARRPHVQFISETLDGAITSDVYPSNTQAANTITDYYCTRGAFEKTVLIVGGIGNYQLALPTEVLLISGETGGPFNSRVQVRADNLQVADVLSGSMLFREWITPYRR